MAGEDAREREEAQLLEHATELPFLEMVRRLEALGGGALVGELGPLEEEVVRFVHDVRLVFHASDVTALRFVRHAVGRRVAEVTTAFLGIVGVVSPVAGAFTEEIARGEHGDDDPLRTFYDAFHHRIVSLLYRALTKYAFALGLRADGGDRFTRAAQGLVGANVGARPRAVAPLAALGASRVLARRASTRAGLEAALALAFPELRVQLEDTSARSVPIPEGQTVQLGVRHSELGVDYLLGGGVPGEGGRLVVHIDPVSRTALEALLPGGRDFARIRAIVIQYGGALFEAELAVAVQPGDEPIFDLGGRDGAILGVNTLLVGARPPGSVFVARVPLTDNAAQLVPRCEIRAAGWRCG